MQTIRLSEATVATLRFEIKGWKERVRDQDLPAYGELVKAGIMEPDGERFRFTEDGMAHRQAILDRESERIERERYAPPDARVSGTARERLRRYLAGDREVTGSNRPAYRELVAARVMIPVHTFVGGREAEYHLTYWGYKLRHELARVTCAGRRPDIRDRPKRRGSARRSIGPLPSKFALLRRDRQFRPGRRLQGGVVIQDLILRPLVGDDRIDPVLEPGPGPDAAAFFPLQ